MVNKKTCAVKLLALILSFMIFSISVTAAEIAGEYDIMPLAIEVGQDLVYEFPLVRLLGDSTIDMSLVRQLDLGSFVTGSFRLNLNINSSIEFVRGSVIFSPMVEWSVIINGVEYFPRYNSSNNGFFNIFVEDITFRYISVKCKLHLYPQKQAEVGDYAQVNVNASITSYSFNDWIPPSTSTQNVTDQKGNQLLEEQNQLQKEQNKLQQEGNKLQEESNKLQKESNETSKGILGKITDFFGGFFTNLGNTVLSWIVPTTKQLTDFLNDVNSWFSDRLGFVWYPFDLAIQLVNALAGGSADTSITLPPLDISMLGSTYRIWDSMKIDIDAFGIFQYVRYFTDVILVAGVAKLAYDKWDEWIGGHGVG